MLETIREYGLDQLTAAAEAEEAREQHAAWCLALVDVAAPYLRGPEQTAWFDRLDAELDNLRLAFDRATASAPELVLRPLGDLLWFWYAREHHGEGRRLLDRALVATDAVVNRPMALHAASVLAWMQGDLERAERVIDEGLEHARSLGDQLAEAYGLLSRACAASMGGDTPRSAAVARDALPLFDEVGDHWGTAMTLNTIANALSDVGDLSAAELHYRRSAELFRDIGDEANASLVIGNMANIAVDRGEFDEAARLTEQCEAYRRRTGNRWGSALDTMRRGYLALVRGQLDEALGHYQDALRSAWETRYLAVLGGCIRSVACVVAGWGRHRLAAELLGMAESVDPQSERYRGWPLEERTPADVREALGDAEFAAAWASGQNEPVEEIVRRALAVSAEG